MIKYLESLERAYDCVFRAELSSRFLQINLPFGKAKPDDAIGG